MRRWLTYHWKHIFFSGLEKNSVMIEFCWYTYDGDDNDENLLKPTLKIRRHCHLTVQVLKQTLLHILQYSKTYICIRRGNHVCFPHLSCLLDCKTSHSVGVAVPVQLQLTELCVVPKDRIPPAVTHLLANPYDIEDRMYLTSVRWSWLEYESNSTAVGRTFTASSIFMSWEWPGISLVICRSLGVSPSTAVTGRWFYFEFLQDSYSTVLYLWHDRSARSIMWHVPEHKF